MYNKDVVHRADDAHIYHTEAYVYSKADTAAADDSMTQRCCKPDSTMYSIVHMF